MADLYLVRITAAALADLDDIAAYRAQVRDLDEAIAWIGELQAHAQRLDRFPLRGPVPKELAATGRMDIRQTMLGSCRIFYQVRRREVAVFMFVDGRRDIPTLLDRRIADPEALD